MEPLSYGGAALRLAVVVAALGSLGARGGCILGCDTVPARTETMVLDAGACPAPLDCTSFCGSYGYGATCTCSVDPKGRAVVVCDVPEQIPGCGD